MGIVTQVDKQTHDNRMIFSNHSDHLIVQILTLLFTRAFKEERLAFYLLQTEHTLSYARPEQPSRNCKYSHRARFLIVLLSIATTTDETGLVF